MLHMSSNKYSLYNTIVSGFAVAMLRVLQIVEGLLLQNRRATKRDIYYTDTVLLKGQNAALTCTLPLLTTSWASTLNFYFVIGISFISPLTTVSTSLKIIILVEAQTPCLLDKKLLSFSRSTRSVNQWHLLTLSLQPYFAQSGKLLLLLSVII